MITEDQFYKYCLELNQKTKPRKKAKSSPKEFIKKKMKNKVDKELKKLRE